MLDGFGYLVTEIALTEGRSVYGFFLLDDAIPSKTHVYKSIEVEDGEKRERGRDG